MDVKRAVDIEHTLPAGKCLDNYAYALSDKVFHTNQLFLYSEKVLPGRKASAPHIHRDIDEIAYITKGELHAFEGGQSTIIRAGDSVCFHANSKEKHYLENLSNEEAEFLIFRLAANNDHTIF